MPPAETPRTDAPGLKPKDLVGIPWRLAFSLQADGWWLRQDIIWQKPNPMPESVRDRCTKAHEYVFLLSKAARYHYDIDAIAEEATCDRIRGPAEHPDAVSTNGNGGLSPRGIEPTRNRRSVWSISTKPFSEAHFATFPTELPEICIKAGTSEHGACSDCGAPFGRVVEGVAPDGRRGRITGRGFVDEDGNALVGDNMIDHGVRGSFNAPAGEGGRRTIRRETTGWAPSCDCDADAVPCTVLDPFGGAGTTGLVADRLKRDAILIELNPEYAAMAERRIRMDAPMFVDVTVEAA